VSLPTIATARLVLRPFRPADADEVTRLAGDRAIAATTLNIPHPYPEGAAAAWIASHEGELARGVQLVLAVTVAAPPAPPDEGQLVGAIGLVMNRHHDSAELGYWIGVPYWGHGYATEAAFATVAHGFSALGLNRIYATHFGGNASSGRVMQKIGMRHEGCRRQHYKKWGAYVDSELYGVLRGEFEERWQIRS
jgi:RimJ/RimL family protein N-acetyltransferase